MKAKLTSLHLLVASILGCTVLVVAHYVWTATIVHDPVTDAHHQLRVLREVVTRYKHDFGSYPTNQVGLRGLVKQGSGGRYFENDKLLVDPWGNAIKYVAEEDGFLLYSLGPNGRDDRGVGDDVGADPEQEG